MNNPDLEFLMNRYLDGQLAPHQRRRLEQILADDPAARRQLDSLRRCDRALHTSLACAPEDHDRHFQAVFSQACDCVVPTRHGAVRPPLRFTTGLAAGLAAGLLIGLGWHMYQCRPRPAKPTRPAPIVQTTAPPALPRPAAPRQAADPPVINDVDLYFLTDDDGRQWLLEAIRQQRPVREIQTVLY